MEGFTGLSEVVFGLGCEVCVLGETEGFVGLNGVDCADDGFTGETTLLLCEFDAAAGFTGLSVLDCVVVDGLTGEITLLFCVFDAAC